MAARWTLARAGIINVYQYGDETFTFGGGRLLLRGVNGSGKSTAMNMLLPFLLEADPRRIDAAGTQTGVLQSWMLNGGDQPQPQGYLWIQFDRDQDHLAFGCGIRASRSTGRVTQWWFITDQQPGIDFSLVEDRHALSIDPLRAVLEPAGSVFTQDQRGAYRSEIRSLLYGGADLDHHLRLLHTVRSPRVGDHVDHDVPLHLSAALPQLSEQALDNAAQPLEELEEHRRNVEALARTTDGLSAMATTYRAYARSELRRRTAEAHDLVRTRTRLERAERAAADRAVKALDERTAAYEDLDRLTQAQRRHTAEIATLKESPEYRSGTELNALRAHVASLAKELERCEARLGTATDRVERALERAGLAEAEHRRHADGLHEQVEGLGSDVRRLHLSATTPGTPAVALETLGTDPPITVPRSRPDATAFAAALGQIRAAARHRAGEVAELRTAIGTAAQAEQDVRDAERAEAQAEAVVARELVQATEAEEDLVTAVAGWHADLATWTDRYSTLSREVSTPWSPPSIDDAAAADATTHHTQIRREWGSAMDGTHDVLARRRAEATSQHEALERTLIGLREEADELASRSFPSPPAQGWQRADRPIVLAEVLDFHSSIEASERAGIEAALLGSGLLGAELAPAGVTLTDGQLHLASAPAAARSLGSQLVPDIPADAPEHVTAELIQNLLAAISVDPADLDRPEGRAAVILTDGRFRVGTAVGRHAVGHVEHVGATARRAALERQKSQLALRIAREEELRDHAAAKATEAGAALDRLQALRDLLPDGDEIRSAAAHREAAGQALDRAQQLAEAQHEAVRTAESVHADASDRVQRLAATHRLPATDAELTSLDHDLRATGDRCTTVEIAAMAASDAAARWIERGREWMEDATVQASARSDLATANDTLLQHQSRLITLEDSVGLPYQEVLASISRCETDLASVEADLDPAADRTRVAEKTVGSTEKELESAVAARGASVDACASALPPLRRAVEVRGLLEAAAEAPSDGAGEPADLLALPTVAEGPDGLRSLADAIDRIVPEPSGPAVTAEGVRSSIRQRRDSLGAGWDAVDTQPDDTLPLTVEVNGPLTRAPLAEAARTIKVQMEELASLLTTQQDQALRNLLQGMVGREVAEKLHAARHLVDAMNQRLGLISTSHGIGVRLRWHRRDDLDEGLSSTVDLLAKLPDLRTRDEDRALAAALGTRIADARREDAEVPYRDLIATVLDYRTWHRMDLLLSRPGRNDERLTKRTVLSEGEKKMVTYLPLFAAAAASHDSLAGAAADGPRFILLDDAFAKVSEDNHPKLFGLLVELDLDFIATSERLWGTHATVPELAITEVIRDAELRTIVLEHFRWDGRVRSAT